MTSDLPEYPDLRSYPNGHRGHTLKLNRRDNLGSCSCGRWSAEGFTERSLVRSHQFHIVNMPTKRKEAVCVDTNDGSK